MSQSVAATGRATTENRLESDAFIRFFLFLATSAATYGLSLLTPANQGPAGWIAALFIGLVLPLILSVVLPETLVRNRLLALFLMTLVGNFAFILIFFHVRN